MPHINQEAASTSVRFSQPVFLIGFFRSGTSLLHAILNQHPQVALMYECNAWEFPEFLSEKRFGRNWLERLEFFNQALSRHRLIFGDSQRGLENVHTPEDLYRTFAEDKSPAFWGEKSPVYCARLKKLYGRYPGCSFIMILRDPLDIYRSVLRASQKAAFFRRVGTLSRFIYYQEQMIQQAAEVSRAGGRVYCVSYDDLVDKPRNTCAGICQFLGIEFDEKMLDLATADLSAVFPANAQHHKHLRRGVIERQKFSQEILSPRLAAKLHRFRSRWNRLQTGWSGVMHSNPGDPEPPAFERSYHNLSGAIFYLIDGFTRVLFEFLPFPWLRGYRLFKEGVLSRRTEERLTLREQFSTHGITIFLSYAVLVFVGILDHFTGPDVTMAPFYMLPPAILSLVVGRRWGISAAVVAVICWSAIQSMELKGSLEFGVVAWNSLMRFVVFLTIVLLLDRVRVEAFSTWKADT